MQRIFGLNILEPFILLAVKLMNKAEEVTPEQTPGCEQPVALLQMQLIVGNLGIASCQGVAFMR